jgi:hypothetical protein
MNKSTMHYKDYSAPSSSYEDYNKYPVTPKMVFDTNSSKKPICSSCNKLCDELFMRIYHSGINTQNYCTARCWGNVKHIKIPLTESTNI